MKKIFFLVSFLSLGFLLTACTKSNTSQPVVNQGLNTNEQLVNQNTNSMNNNQNVNEQVPVEGTVTQYTLAEVSQHNNANDCWLVANSKVYKVTEFISQHPGGDKILQGCGKDMTEFFNTKHMKQSKEKLPEFYIGDLKQ